MIIVLTDSVAFALGIGRFDHGYGRNVKKRVVKLDEKIQNILTCSTFRQGVLMPHHCSLIVTLRGSFIVPIVHFQALLLWNIETIPFSAISNNLKSLLESRSVKQVSNQSGKVSASNCNEYNKSYEEVAKKVSYLLLGVI